MRYWASLFVPGMVLAMCAGALAQGTTYKLGRTPSQEEIRAWDIDISPDGKGLPPGSGTAKEGAAIYVQRCMKCHGRDGEQQIMGSSMPGSALVGRGPNNVPRPPGEPLATIYWDHINRAMPRYEEGSLSANEVYSLTAYVLYMQGVIQQNDVMDAKSLPKVRVPSRTRFNPAPQDIKSSMSCDPNLLRCLDYWEKSTGKAK